MRTTVDYNLKVDKDGKEVIDVIAKIEAHMLQKKPFAELLSELPAVMGAIDGWENAVAAAKGSGMSELAGYAVHKFLEPFEKEDVPAS